MGFYGVGCLLIWDFFFEWIIRMNRIDGFLLLFLNFDGQDLRLGFYITNGNRCPAKFLSPCITPTFFVDAKKTVLE